ncbi:hypothetical protein [Burkholderia ubonensis]|uniref:hypothetical protein n=1 Tax=Burkholderia ubonensis TaxID=101571 RepID=UPI0012FA9257|nr:hypothetical protein [Burkholderia ubonensis]
MPNGCGGSLLGYCAVEGVQHRSSEFGQKETFDATSQIVDNRRFGIPPTAHQFMSRPLRPPDLIVNFSLTAHRSGGSSKKVISGYRPIYKVRNDYGSSAHHEFVDATGVCTGHQCKAEVWLLSPEAYPHTFWLGRRVEVAEGSRVVGVADVLEIVNPLLELSADG